MEYRRRSESTAPNDQRTNDHRSDLHAILRRVGELPGLPGVALDPLNKAAVRAFSAARTPERGNTGLPVILCRQNMELRSPLNHRQLQCLKHHLKYGSNTLPKYSRSQGNTIVIVYVNPLIHM